MSDTDPRQSSLIELEPRAASHSEITGSRNLSIGEIFQDAPFAPEMVAVPPGEFMMGSPPEEAERLSNEGPQHRVAITRPFAVGRYQVTFDEWDRAQEDADWLRLTGFEPRMSYDQGWGRGRRPVIYVSWHDAHAYARWLSAKTGQAYRLPSEAEWEYVCRAGTSTPFWWGETITTAHANYNGKYTYKGDGKGEHRKRTVPVDEFEPNPFGLFQVHGNVWEWVEDCWNENYEHAPCDGSSWTTGHCDRRVLRGGSWFIGPRALRAAIRLRCAPGYRDHGFGFRLVRAL